MSSSHRPRGRRGPGALPGRPRPRFARRPRRGGDLLTLEVGDARVHVPAGRLESFLRGAGVDLCMDLRARRAWIRGRWISLDANELPGRILEAVARNRGRRVALDALFRVAWGRELRNLHDRRAVYAAVGRLREDLADVDPTGSLLVAEAGGYRLGEGWGLAWIHRPPMVPAGGLEARIRALASPGPVAPRNIRRVVGGSPAHLRRILVRMTREGLLRRVGAGRSTAYQAVPG